METRKFENGISAVAGVLKSKTPDTFNIKFVTFSMNKAI